MTRRSWKKNILYLSPLILACITQIVIASEGVNENEQQVLETSIEKTQFQYENEGQQLYNEAIKQLEAIEKKFNQQKLNTKQDQYLSFTDRLIQKITVLMTTSGPSTEPDSKKELEQLKQSEMEAVTLLLEKAVTEYENNDALLQLAELNFYSKYAYPRNYQKAFYYYDTLASKGNATAQQMIGFIYATGIGNVVERDQAKALLYHTFAAHGGETTAEITMGYRYLLGIGTDEKCEDALYHYKRVASKIIDYYLSGPPGGHTPPPIKVRLSEEKGGVYGYGASVTTEKRSRSGGNGNNGEKAVSIDEILQYWKYLAAKQDVDAQLMLGQVYYLGTRSVPRNFGEAYSYFHQIVDKISTSGKVPAKNSKAIGQAAGYLGLMYWRGEGVATDDKTAYKWFSIGVELGDSVSQNAVGTMYLEGSVLAKNRDKAIEFFKKAADQENPNAQVNLAIELAQTEANIPVAIRLFTKAADAKHLLAFWYLAHMNEQNIMPRSSCHAAVSYYKAIAEKGDWLYPTIETAYNAYTKDDKETALLNYMLAAERGYEVAQSNVAYILDKDKRILSHIPLIGSNKSDELEKENETIHGVNKDKVALIYWTHSANQNNIDSRVKMGDYYYKGIGTKVDYEKAASCYRIAADVQLSPMAHWNLGWMYENGIGLSKDFHLAKRAYDQALNLEPDAYLPVKLSLIKMYIKYYWEWITGHEVGPALAQSDDSAVAGDSSLVDKKLNRNKKVDDGTDKNSWEDDIGEEMKRQYKKMKQKEREENEQLEDGSDTYTLDEFGEDGEMLENLLILSLCMVVGYLIYVRQFRLGNNDNQRNDNPVPRFN